MRVFAQKFQQVPVTMRDNCGGSATNLRKRRIAMSKHMGAKIAKAIRIKRVSALQRCRAARCLPGEDRAATVTHRVWTVCDLPHR